MEIKTSEEFGSNYYTLTYQPQEGNLDGRFRHIRVSLRDPGLHVLAKAGYYAPDKTAPEDPQRQNRINLAEAAQSTIPFTALDLTIEKIVRHPDTDSVDFNIVLKSRNINWQTQDDGTGTTQLVLAAASLSGRRDILASKLESFTVTTPNQDPARLAKQISRLPVTVPFPRKAQGVRIVIQVTNSGRMGAIEVGRKVLDAAPEAPTPDPLLLPRLEHPRGASPSSNP